MKRTFSFLFSTFLAGTLFAGNGQVAKDLESLDPAANVDVIVQFRQAPTAAHHQKVKDKGGLLKRSLGVIQGALYSVPAGKLNDLAGDPDVTYISPDRRVRGSLDYATPAVNANIAYQYGWDGTGIGIAIIDSGMDNKHPDLQAAGRNTSRVVYSQAFSLDLSGWTNDKNGHGTHVSGIAAGNGAATAGSKYTKTFRGIAPKANIINLRVLDDNASGTDSLVIAAIDRAIQLKTQYNIRVINLSLGHPVYESYTTDPLCQAVEKAWQAGIVVVVAAGNEGRNNSFGNSGYGTILSPANDPLVITVGAMKTLGTISRADDQIASYSSKGPTSVDHIVKPDVVAPGNRIISLYDTLGRFETQYPTNTVPVSYYTKTGSSRDSPAYYQLSGTSMATPVVSGAVALLLQQNPGLTPDQVKARLMKTASKSFPATSTAIDPVSGALYTSQYDIFTIGAGYLDIWAALNNTDLAVGRAASPTAVYDSATGKVYVVNTSSAAWGTSAAWGSSAAWGTSAVWGGTVWVDGGSAAWGAVALWGSSAAWGSGTASAMSAVWGSSAAWGTSTPSAGADSATVAATSITSPESINVAINGEN